MTSDHWRDVLPARLRVMQIIIGAMTIGCIFLFAVILAISFPIARMSETHSFTYIALGIAFVVLILRSFFPTLVVVAGRRQIRRNFREASETQGARMQAQRFDQLEDEAGRRLIDLLQGKILVGAALMEGSAFLSLISYLPERSPISLAVAAIMIVFLTLHFPTGDRASNWIENQLQLLKNG